MLVDSYYVNQSPIRAQIDTGLAQDELESIVGRFHDKHERVGHLKGEIIVYSDGSIKIRHHFTKKILWESE